MKKLQFLRRAHANIRCQAFDWLVFVRTNSQSGFIYKLASESYYELLN
jgi:hypothetical protein